MVIPKVHYKPVDEVVDLRQGFFLHLVSLSQNANLNSLTAVHDPIRVSTDIICIVYKSFWSNQIQMDKYNYLLSSSWFIKSVCRTESRVASSWSLSSSSWAASFRSFSTWLSNKSNSVKILSLGGLLSIVLFSSIFGKVCRTNEVVRTVKWVFFWMLLVCIYIWCIRPQIQFWTIRWVKYDHLPKQ